MLQNMGYRLISWSNFWPFLIIAAGVAMIWGRFDRPNLYVPARDGQPQERMQGPSDPDFVEAFALFGGIRRRVHTSELKGGQITAMFGGVELDLRLADFEGEEVSIYMDAIFGGIELIVPDRWSVIWQGQNIFGGYSDQTRAPLPDVGGATPLKRLRLNGRALF